MQRTLIAKVLLLAGLTCAPLTARADAIEDFYKGRQMKAIVGNPAGGDYDIPRLPENPEYRLPRGWIGILWDA